MLWISCSKPNSQDKLNTFFINSLSGITSLDPVFAQTQENIRFVNQLFNGLLALDEDLYITPSIAKSWNISTDGKVYTFVLRSDVFFHNSEVFGSRKTRKVSAKDFVFSFDRLINPNTASDGAWIFNDIVSDAPFVAINDTILEIRLKKKHAPLLSLLTMAYCFVVPMEAVEFYGKDFGRYPVGTGPFKFANWEQGIRLNLVRNNHYFDHKSFEQSNLDALSVSFIESSSLALLTFLQGKSDIFTGLESAFKDELLDFNGNLKKDKNHLTLVKTPFLNTEYIAFKSKNAADPLSNVKLRKAINYAIDRNQMVTFFRNNIGNPAQGGFIPLGLPGHTSWSTSLFQPQEAARLVSALHEEGVSTNLTLSTTKEYADLSVLIQKYCKDVGIDIKIEILSSAVLKERKNQGDLSLFRGSWIADYPNAENYLSCFYSKNKSPLGPNYTHFDHSEYDYFYEKLLEAVHIDSLQNISLKMENILFEEVPLVVLFYDVSTWFVQRGVSGVVINSMNHLNLHKTRKEK